MKYIYLSKTTKLNKEIIKHLRKKVKLLIRKRYVPYGGHMIFYLKNNSLIKKGYFNINFLDEF